MKIRRVFVAGLAAICSVAAMASVPLVKNGKPVGRILIDGDSGSSEAADLLQDFVGRISGAKVPVTGLDGVKSPKKGDVVIQRDETGKVKEDGFRISTDNGVMTISGDPGKGAAYGVVTLLEDYLGVNYYGKNEYSLAESKEVTLPDVNREEAPAFRYRQSQSYALADDPVYRIWMRLEEPGDEFAGRLWVHTFDRLLPSDVYGKSHPEYYSFINGQHRPGKASQWCLSNPEVFEIVAARIDSIFDANPGLDMISVSQNDGNFTYCTCEACAAVTEAEGTPSGNIIRFLNKLAERRPDKQFSTLAYLFSMQPPKITKPLPNVNIMLCDIDAKREVPLTDNASGQAFVKAIEGWSKISDNIFVWDYGINFDNYLAPFPNFPILQKNIQLFRDHNAKMHFSQIAGSYGGDFSELRTYMVSKLMWNPDVNTDSLMHKFMEGYYGAAAPYLYEYEKLLEGALLGSHKELWIYDSPVSHKDGMLTASLRKRYNELFDKAEEAVKDDKTLLDRVRRQRLSLQFSELEIERAEGRANGDYAGKVLEVFEERVKEYGIPTLNERSNSPVDYSRLYHERYRQTDNSNLAANAEIKWVVPPTGRYAENGAAMLTDGIYGGTSFVESWVGWEGKDGEFIVDLGKECEISSVSGDFLHQLGQWIFYPKFFEVWTSADGENYTEMGKTVQPEDREAKVKFQSIGVTADKPVKARYVKVRMGGMEVCPGWHYGVGCPGWIFIDEIVVK